MGDGLVRIDLDNVSFQLREPVDFRWLSEFGTAFAVFDAQDSGNLCFGVRAGDTRRFVKYAGARTRELSGDPRVAVERLRVAERVYQDLGHPTLIPLIQSVDLEHGFALVFEWRDGECLNAHWDYEAHPKYTDSKSAFVRFRSLPVAERVSAFEGILDFHCFVEHSNYVAVDFYDGSIMYDFGRHRVSVCDVDFYRKMPTSNDMGRMWGSSRFMSPEEHILGSPIDSVTNVYTMGATAFSLLGDDRDWSREKWCAGQSLYEVARRATAKDRSERFKTVAQLKSEWIRSR